MGKYDKYVVTTHEDGQKTKKCRTCLEDLELSNYHAGKGQPNGRSDCKSCYRQLSNTRNNAIRRAQGKKPKLIFEVEIVNGKPCKVCTSCLKTLPAEAFGKDVRYAQKLLAKCAKCVGAYSTHRYRTIEHERLGTTLRSRVRMALNAAKATKQYQTNELIGCTILEYKDYLESRFLPGMSWNNRSEWHIDHIRPCVSFDLTDPMQQKQCFHFSNTQPLWCLDNLKKGSKYTPQVVVQKLPQTLANGEASTSPSQASTPSLQDQNTPASSSRPQI